MGRTFDKQVLFGLALVVALLVLGAGLAYRNTTQLSADSRLVAHTHEVMELTDGVLLTLLDAETGERGFLLTGAQTFLEPYHDAQKHLDERLAKLRQKALDSAQQANVQRLMKLAKERLALITEAVEQQAKFKDSAQAVRLTTKGKEKMDAVQALVEEMKQREADLLQDRQRRTRNAYQIALVGSLFTTLVGLLLVGAFFWLLHRSLQAHAKVAAVVQEQRQLLQTTLSSIGDAVIATDAEGRVTFLNDVAQELTGFHQEEASGQQLDRVFRIINEKNRQPVANTALRAIEEGRIVGLNDHTVLISRNGTKRPIEDSTAPICDEHGTLRGAVLVFRDVTERKLADEKIRESREQLRQRADQLAEADQRKDEFLATLAHELRNPLAPIRNALHIMRLAAADGAMLAQVRDIMERQVKQMVRLIDDLLDISRITRGKITLRKARLDLASVIETALETSRPLIDNSKHELTVKMPPQPLTVMGDQTRLAQVVSNLLNNSAKYTPEAGHILLTLERHDGQAHIKVRDDGMGIPAPMLPKVFQMFTQVERTLDRSQGGLGIGLSLVRRLVEMHGGTVDAHSEGTGRGSEFVVRLPLAPSV